MWGGGWRRVGSRDDLVRGLHGRASALGEGEDRPGGPVCAVEGLGVRQPPAAEKRVSDLRPPELGARDALPCAPPSSRCAVTAAQATEADLFSYVISK